MPTGDHWLVLGQRICDQRTSGLGLFARAQRCRRIPETSEFALTFIESLAKLATTLPFLMFSQHWAFFTFSFSQSQVKLHGRWLSRGWWCSAVSRATLFCRSSLWNRPVPSLADVDPTAFVKLAMDVVERKEAMPEKSENDARKDWAATWKNLKARTN